MKISLYCFVFVSLVSCSTGSSESVKSDDSFIKEVVKGDVVLNEDFLKLEKLKKAYELCADNMSEKNQQIYFEVFPAKFKDFAAIFGDIDPTERFKSGPLYEEAYDYVAMFFGLDLIDRDLYYKRLIDISINGEWDADAVNYFQHGMVEVVENNLNAITSVLSKLKDSELVSFWFFYFDGPHPEARVPDELVDLKSLDMRVYNSMMNSLTKVQNKWK